MDTAEAAPAELETLSFDEKIELGPFFVLSLKNALLNIITLSLYRFWGKTEVRRRLWARIRLNGEAFEYTGKGKELFFGFLVALVIIGVPYLAIVLGIQFLDPTLAVLLFIPIYLAFFVLIGAAIFLTFRYIASRTTWRGVRFQVRGDALGYGLGYLGYSWLTGLTLGWYAPAMSMRLAENLWSKLRFGDQPFRWIEAKTPSVYQPFALFWLLGVVGYFGSIGLAVGARVMAESGAPDPEALKALLTGSAGGLLLLLPVYLIFVLIAWCAYHAAILRRIAASIRLGEARFSLKIGTFGYLGLMLVNLLILIFSLGLLVPLIQARTARYLVRNLKSEGGAPLSEALQAPSGPRTGEGLADAFDMGFI